MLIKLIEAQEVGQEYTDRHNRHSARVGLTKRERYVNPANVVDVHPYTFPTDYLTEENRKQVGSTFSKVITTKGDFIAVGSPSQISEALNGKELLKG
jgi:hypothetical protein